MTELRDHLRNGLPIRPDAPVPTQLRDHLLKRRASKRRRLQLLGGAAAIILVATLLSRSAFNGGDHISVETASNQSAAEIVGSTPTAATSAGTPEITVVLPSGETILVAYPQELGLAEMGIEAAVGLSWPVRPPSESGFGDSCCSRSASILHEEIESLFGDLPILGEMTTADGRRAVVFEQTSPAMHDAGIVGRVLAVDFAPWTAVVHLLPAESSDAMSQAELGIFVGALAGELTEGQLMLTPESPVSLEPTDSPDIAFDRGAVSLAVRECPEVGEPVAELPAGPVFTTDAGVVVCFEGEGITMVFPASTSLDLIGAVSVEPVPVDLAR